MGFEDYTTVEEIQDYQRKVLLRPGTGGKRNVYLNHYTDINSLIGIIDSKKILLSSCVKMNDNFEEQLISNHNMEKNLFYLCLSKAEESLAMYKMYQKGEGDSLIIRFLYSDIEKLLKESVGAYLYATEILYLNSEDNTLCTKSRANKNISFPFRERKLVGSIKFGCWKYEEEVRICAYTDESLSSDDKVEIPLPSDVINNIEVIFAPGFDSKKHESNIQHIMEYNIQCRYSRYTDYYSDVLQS